MIRSLLVGAARCLFNLSVLAFLLAGLLLYGSYRLLRAGMAKDGGQPVREAGFASLVALIGLARAIQQQAQNAPRPTFETEETIDGD